MGRMKWGVLAVAVAAAACGNRATEPADTTGAGTFEAGDTIRLAVGQSARIRGTQVAVAFRAVAEDSRCPIDALCVWAGDAVARIDVTTGTLPWQSKQVHLNVEPRTVDFAGYTFKLVEVLPAPVSTRRTQSGEYSIGLEVVRR